MTVYLDSAGFRVVFMWMSREVGGHSSDPYIGMRLTMRWQRHIAENLKLARDVECLSIDYDQNLRQGVGVFRLNVNNPVPEEWMEIGEIIEFLNGFRVLAVGKLLPDADS